MTFHKRCKASLLTPVHLRELEIRIVITQLDER